MTFAPAQQRSGFAGRIGNACVHSVVNGSDRQAPNRPIERFQPLDGTAAGSIPAASTKNDESGPVLGPKTAHESRDGFRCAGKCAGRLALACQRWRDRRDSYRPAGEPIRTSLYDVAAIGSDRVARAFVEQHHYSGSYPAARARFGLYRRGELVGVAVLSQPPSQAALIASVPLPIENVARAELGRFVLLDDVPANGESWFLARCFELARAEGFAGVVAHSDPEQRTSASGAIVFAGHLGTIYCATNATYCGRTPARTWRLLPDGTLLSARALSKLRLQDRGWRYVVELLLKHGAPAPAGDWRAWCARAVNAVSRTYRHRGNHRYLWALDRRLRRHLPASLPYPKWEGGAL
jgi:hypothetical protein